MPVRIQAGQCWVTKAAAIAGKQFYFKKIFKGQRLPVSDIPAGYFLSYQCLSWDALYHQHSISCHFRPWHCSASLSLSSPKQSLTRLRAAFRKQRWKTMKDGKDVGFFVLTLHKWLGMKTLGHFRLHPQLCRPPRPSASCRLQSGIDELANHSLNVSIM